MGTCRVTQVDFVLLNRASLEQGGSSRRYQNPGIGKKGGRGLTSAKIITNKRLYDASAIGSLCVARFLNNIVNTLTLQIVELR